MENSNGAGRYNTPVKYNKTLTLTMADGTTKPITGMPAQRIQKYLEDDRRFIYLITDEDTGTIEFYALSQTGCGFCKVASLVPSATPTTPVPCEDGMPNCPDDTLNPTTASLALSTELVQVEVGKTAIVTATAIPEDATITWTSGDTTIATVADGVITGVKAGNTTITVKATKTTGSGSTATTTTLATGTVTVMVAAAGSLVNPITGGSTANK